MRELLRTQAAEAGAETEAEAETMHDLGKGVCSKLFPKRKC